MLLLEYDWDAASMFMSMKDIQSVLCARTTDRLTLETFGRCRLTVLQNVARGATRTLARMKDRTRLDRLRYMTELGIIPSMNTRDDLVNNVLFYHRREWPVVNTSVFRWYWKVVLGGGSQLAVITTLIQSVLEVYPGRKGRCDSCCYLVPVSDMEDETTCSFCVDEKRGIMYTRINGIPVQHQSSHLSLSPSRSLSFGGPPLINEVRHGFPGECKMTGVREDPQGTMTPEGRQ